MLAIHDAVMIHFETPTMFAKQLDAIRETGKCTVFYLHLLVSLGVLSVGMLTAANYYDYFLLFLQGTTNQSSRGGSRL